MSDAGRDAYGLSFVLSPIILTNGLAQLVPGGMLPIIALTEALNFTTGLLSGGDAVNLENFFAHFVVVPGGTLINNAIGKYPFANQAVAANAIIAQPLNISMRMICPARGDSAYAVKLATLMALKAALDSHNNTGGTYTVATPANFYTNLVMTGMKDVTQNVKQPQSEWQLDFEQPLLTESQALLSMNSMMSKIGAGLPTDGATSGIGLTVGSPPSLATSGIAPVASDTAGTGVSGSTYGFAG